MLPHNPQNQPADAQPEKSFKHTNRLINETSPYLLQHAHNPVDWWPWEHDAFEEARKRGVPIFVSIGYSTCYWCHVMERESFENETIAAAMNKNFVCIKVDREERPDVDNIYMTATQIYTGRGGWPMSVFLEPEKLRPFWCGTYFPAEERPGMNIPTFPKILTGISQAWQTQRDNVLKQADAIAQSVRQQLEGQATPVPVGIGEVEKATNMLLGQFDSVNGGFGGAPKFPQTSFLTLLLDARENATDKALVDAMDHAIRKTLDAMAIGGIRDHVGGGFHRYATDATWTVPHFEKMLYDQALLTLTFVRAARFYKNAEYKRVVRETLDYVLREMTSPDGGFYSAQDAEVSGHEGQNYLWTPAQMHAALDQDDATFAMRVYGLDKGPNFQDPHDPSATPTNVLRFSALPEDLAREMHMPLDAFLMKLATINRELYKARMKRPQPRLDDKVIAQWNGLMIAAFANAAALLDEDRYYEAAKRASNFVLENMTDQKGGLLRASRNGKGSVPGVLEDYSMMILGLLRLYAATEQRSNHAQASPILDTATDLDDIAITSFRGQDGGYFDTRADQEDLFVRSRTTYDGAIPCSSSVMLHDLIDLATATGKDSYLERAVTMLQTLSSAISHSPLATSNSTQSLLRLLHTTMPATHPEVFASAPELGDEPPEKPCPEHPDLSPVEIYAEVDQIEVSDDTPAQLTLLVRIAKPYHLTAADPGLTKEGEDLGLFPFRIQTIGGSGITAYADYPKGQKHGLADQTFYAYQGKFELTVAVEKTGPIVGKPRLAATYQACTDTECLMPATVELDVAIHIK